MYLHFEEVIWNEFLRVGADLHLSLVTLLLLYVLVLSSQCGLISLKICTLFPLTSRRLFMIPYLSYDVCMLVLYIDPRAIFVHRTCPTPSFGFSDLVWPKPHIASYASLTSWSFGCFPPDPFKFCPSHSGLYSTDDSWQLYFLGSFIYTQRELGKIKKLK